MQDPLLPPVTSLSPAPLPAYGYAFGYVPATGVPATAYVAAIRGDAALVPPYTAQPPPPYVW